MIYVWIGLIVVFLVIEAATVNLTTIWFALGSVGGLIAAICRAPIWLQCVIFVVISVAALFALKPFAKKFINPLRSPTNADRVIGHECIVTEQIDNLKASGKVTVDGKTWTARSDDGSVIEAGEKVTALRIEGVKLMVSAPAAEINN